MHVQILHYINEQLIVLGAFCQQYHLALNVLVASKSIMQYSATKIFTKKMSHAASRR